MKADRAPSEQITIDLQLDASLTRAASWRGLSVEAYVRLVVATMAEADANLADFACDSLACDGRALGTQEELDAWFAERERRDES